MSETFIVLFLAMFLDELTGDPVYRFHPVRLMGTLFRRIEEIIRKGHHFQNVTAERLLGVFYLLLCCTLPLTLLSLTYRGLFFLWRPLTWLFGIYVFFSMYAQKDLLLHAEKVFTALEKNSLAAARQRVSYMVGRNTEVLDEPGIIRAAIESVAENYVDGSFTLLSGTMIILAVSLFSGYHPLVPVLIWAVFFRTVNTLDAMVGYKNDRYRYFGWASARLDDILNYLPARLSLFPLAAGVATHKGNLKRAISDFFRYGNSTPSPNSGYPESFMAGALNIPLAGPIVYGDSVVDKGWIGSGIEIPRRAHLEKAVRIIRTAGRASFLVMALFALFFFLSRF